MNSSAIYIIKSKSKSERIYIGSAIKFSKRKNRHLFDLRHNKHHSTKLQRHYNKYGENDLSFSILMKCDKEILIQAEQNFIDMLNPFFNECKIAGSTQGVSFPSKKKGVSMSLEQRKKLCISQQERLKREKRLGIKRVPSKKYETEEERIQARIEDRKRYIEKIGKDEKNRRERERRRQKRIMEHKH